jgi:hypothetical protein
MRRRGRPIDRLSEVNNKDDPVVQGNSAAWQSTDRRMRVTV